MDLVSARHMGAMTEALYSIAWWRVRMLATVPPTCPAHRPSDRVEHGSSRYQRCFHTSALILSNRFSHEPVDVGIDEHPRLADPNDPMYARIVDEDAMFVAHRLLGTR